MDETAGSIAIGSTALAALSLGVSFLSLVIAFWVARRDNARVKVECSIGAVNAPILLASPQVTAWDVTGKTLCMIEVVNSGRRPVTINVAGLRFRTTGLWRAVFWDWDRKRPDRAVWVTTNSKLPARLDEQSKIIFFSTLDDLRGSLATTLKSRHQLRDVFADDVGGRRHSGRVNRHIRRPSPKVSCSKSREIPDRHHVPMVKCGLPEEWFSAQA